MAVAATSKPKKPAPGQRPTAPLEPLRDAERTRQALLAAAEVEFSTKGLAGARVDVIAEQAAANKRMLYYYFGSKEDLYLAVLERAYGAMRETERELNLTDLEPLEAIKTLVEFKFDYCQQHQQIITLLGRRKHAGRQASQAVAQAARHEHVAGRRAHAPCWRRARRRACCGRASIRCISTSRCRR